jgi:ketosteroid isomerase-like protein
MTPEQRFFEYASAFEETYRDDDWSRLEPFLADDVTYEVRNTPFDCRLEGRAAVLRGLRRSLDGFDRRCASRRVEVTDPARSDGDTVTVGWAGTYGWPGAPDLRFRGRSSATVRDGRIVALVDEYPDGESERMAAWMVAHAPDLDASYV